MSQSTVSTIESASSSRSSSFNRQDLMWMLGLYGTAIGAGTLFLPINAGIGGFWPLIIMTLLALPMTYFAHRGLTRFVLAGSSREEDITEVVEEYFGPFAGKFITLLYFFAIYPIILIYSVAITNTLLSFIHHQLHLTAPPRFIIAAIAISSLMFIVHFGKEIIVKTMSVLVFPFLIALLGLSLYLMPHWNFALFHQGFSSDIHVPDFLKTLWLVIPVMVFSFNHSPIISSFAVSQKMQYQKNADNKSTQILFCSHSLMVMTVIFFVFSCVLSLTPADLSEAKAQNISILSYLANHFQNPFIAYAAPLIALVAIAKSFLGHYLGAKEGFKGVVNKFYGSSKTLCPKRIEKLTTLFFGITAWLAASLNPSILRIIESLGGPIIAMLLFIMPMYAIYKVPALHQYKNNYSNYFVTIMGMIAISAIFYTFLH